jgi:glucose/arabinose dehydrogenase
MQLKAKLRRRRLYLLVFCLLVAGKVSAQQVQGLDAIRVASGLSSPLFVAAAPGDLNRLFIVQQGGQISILNLNTGVMNATPFLTVANIVSGGEQGLLGLAFDPNYATNGKFYVNCTAPGGAFNAGITQIRQYQISSNPDIADTTPANIKTVLAFDQPQTNHNGGWIGFSPRTGDDHNLYIATGDGGAANDQDGGVGHIEPGGNAQILNRKFGCSGYAIRSATVSIDQTAACLSATSARTRARKLTCNKRRILVEAKTTDGVYAKEQ